MPWNTRRLTPQFGVELSGQRIGPDLPLAEAKAVYDAVVEHGIAVVTGQSLDDADIQRFGMQVGEVVLLPAIDGVDRSAVSQISNVDREGNLLLPDSLMVRGQRASYAWHIDSTYLRPRATLSMLYGRIIPPKGGNTHFCDLRAAWDALPAEERRRLEPLMTGHSLMHTMRRGGVEFSEEEQARFPPIPRPLVQRHPETGRKALCLACHIEHIDGMSDEEAQALVIRLMKFAAVPERCYVHHWTEGDLMLWDNRSVMHHGTPFRMAKYRRDMRSLRLKDLADA